MYKHSNEIEEVSVINLNGVNIESSPEMEALLGVSVYRLILSQRSPPVSTETLHIQSLYSFEFLRTCGT